MTDYTNSSQLSTLLELIIEQSTGTAIGRTMSQAAVTQAVDDIKARINALLNGSFYNDPKIQLLLNEAAEGKKMIVDALNDRGQSLEYDTPYLQIQQIIRDL